MPVMYFKTILAITIFGTASVWFYKKRKERITDVFKKLVFITGCDSGFGYSVALHCHELGLTVCASMLNPEGEAGKRLKLMGETTKRLHVIRVDVTDSKSVKEGCEAVRTILKSDDLELHAIVNNAGVMVFAENEWQTENLIQQQIEVNLIGAIRVTKYFSPLLRQYKSRVVNISSHCALEALPGLAVYAGSKAGLQSWSDGLRVELQKYGVKVISFVPGSFFGQSNILACQKQQAELMKKSMPEEDFEFYGDYFERFNSYLCNFSGERPIEKLKNNELYEKLNHIFLSPNPKPYYNISPRRYTIYHCLFKLVPTVGLRDRLVERFMQMPKFKN